VASKADKVHPQDRHKLKPLLDDLAGKLARDSGRSDIDSFACSAVNSTTPLPGKERKLVGRPIWENKDGRPVYRSPAAPDCEVTVPALPEHWPHDAWKPEAYNFTDFHPAIPAVYRQAPAQMGLDEVLKFVLDA
jgi:predicted YcjX-like family ATPase